MIHFNKTFFQFAKRSALVAFCLFFSAGAWAGKSYNSKLTVKTNGAASGLVYISNEKEAGTIRDNQWKESEHTEEQSGPGTWNGYNTHTYYIYAKSPANGNYRWGGWYDSETAADPIQNTIALEGNHKHEVKIETEKLYDYYYEDANGNGMRDQGEEWITIIAYEEKTYVAKWLLPRITQTYIESIKDEQIKHIKTITNTDPNQNVTFETIVFNTVDASSLDDFKPLEVPEGFIKNSATVTTQGDLNNLQLSPKEYAILYSNSQCFVKVAIPITPIQDLTGKQYTFKLTSKYYESIDKQSSGVAEIIVKQDYTPKFGYNTSTVLWIRGSEEKNIKMQWLNEVAEHTQTYWKTTLTGNGAFQISSGSDTYSPVIKYTEPEGILENPTATLIITCYYKNNTENTDDDIQSEIIPAENGDALVDEQGNKIRQLTITLEADPRDQIVFSPNEWDFGTIICGELVEKEDIAVFHNLTADPTFAPAETNNEAFTFSASDWNNKNAIVTATVNSSLLTPSNTQYTATYTATGQNDVSATFTVKVTVDLGTPKLSGSPGNRLVELTWVTIPGTARYEIEWYGNGMSGTIDIDNPTLTSYQHKNLTNGESYTYKLKAICNDIEKVSNPITITPQYYPDFIAKVHTVYDDGSVAVAANKTGLYTGSFADENTHEIDVSAAFAGENVQFEWLYLFGEGVGEKIPCYIYRKNSDSRYEFVVQVEMTESVKNGTYFNVNTDMKSLYLTGYCEKATTGTKWNENGVLQVKKGTMDNFNLYLDGLWICAKDKGQTKLTITNKEELNNYWGRNFAMEGSGDILVFDMTDGLYTPYIHIRGENYLKSTNSLNLELAGKAKVDDKTELPLYINYEQNPSVIKIMVNNEDQKASLNIIDTWHDLENQQNIIRTNGSLYLNSIDANKPLINLGYKNSELIINGGQVYFNNKNEVVATAYNYAKRQDKIDKDNQPETYMYGCSSATLDETRNTSLVNGTYAFTSDAECAVQFKDGTISAATSPLLCPTNTTIDGGSFNCAIKAGTSDNIYSSFDATKALVKLDIDVTDYIQEGKVVIPDHDDFMDEIFPQANYKNNEMNKYESLSNYYPDDLKYGLSSLTPEGNIVHLMLHQDGKPTINQWAIAGRNVNILKNTENVMTLEGQVRCVDQVEGDEKLFGQTYKMLYMEKDAFGYLDNAGNEYQIDNGYSVSSGDNTYEIQPQNAQTTIINTKQYTIKEKVYILKPVVAAKWMLFTPPFDVANVYIIESYPEDQLVKDFCGDNPNKTITGENIKLARQAQAQRTMDLYLSWYGGRESSKDFFESEFLTQWKLYESMRDKNGERPAEGSNYMPAIGQLINFIGKDKTYPDGMRWWDANYYIYKSTDDWTFDQAAAKFGTTWELVETLPGDNVAIMQAGETYAIEFPYNLGGHNPNDMWDYWTGKYILIESTEGPHTILGSEFAMVDGATASDGSAFLWGNSTFASCTIPTDANAWVMEKCPISSGDIDLGDGKIATVTRFENKFVQATDVAPKELLPTENFLLANFQAPAQMRARSINYKSGEVEYEKIDDNNTGDIETGLPTIMNGMTLIVEPTSEGLTITPIKEQHVMLFDADGKMIFSKHLSAEENVTLPTGVYVVRGEYEQVKAIKK